MLLKNKNAIVYGAGGAIGGAVARAFAREGAKVFLVGRTLGKVGKVAEEISAAGGLAAAADFDALDEQAVEQHAAAVVARAGGIDVSFNAIDIKGSIQGTPLIDLSPENLSQPVRDRLAANFLTARTAARHMIKKRTGAILMITATPARMAFPLTGSFGVEGAAIEGFCRSLASELGPQGVRVICLQSAGSPESFPDTGSADTALGKSREAIAAQLAELTLLKRTPTLLEVGNVAAFMASDYASPMTACRQHLLRHDCRLTENRRLVNSTATPNHALQRTAPRVTVAAILARTRPVQAGRCPTSVASFCAPPSQLPRHAPLVAELGVVRLFYAH